jgi:type IV pilus biogenesis protein CpaD/CtpE
MQKWAALLLCLGLTACYLDPYDNPGNWSLTGATRRNIAAQAANPSDLINAKSNPDSDGVAASSAIDKGFAGSGGTAAGVLPPPSPTTLDVTGG